MFRIRTTLFRGVPLAHLGFLLLRATFCLLEDQVFAYHLPDRASEQELEKAEALTKERMREGKVDDQLENVLKVARTRDGERRFSNSLLEAAEINLAVVCTS